MRHTLQLLLVLASASLALASAGCSRGQLSGGDAGGNDGGEPSTLACSAATDCTRSEIDHEIHSAADCVCLLGCPFTIMNVETANRRVAQYQALCTPGKNAQGQPCPVDDCVQPASLACIGGRCAVESLPE